MSLFHQQKTPGRFTLRCPKLNKQNSNFLVILRDFPLYTNCTLSKTKQNKTKQNKTKNKTKL